MRLSVDIFGGERWSMEDTVFQAAVYLVTVALLLLVLVPVLIVISVSFTPASGLFDNPAVWLPETITLRWWTSGFAALQEGLVHSVVISVGTALIAMAVTIPGAYVFGRKEFWGKQFVFYAIVLSLLFPTVVLVVPVTTRWLEWGLYNSYVGLWIAFQIFITPFAIWILRDYFSSLPENLEEAAQVYGCTEFGAFVRVILPIARPALIAVGFLAFLNGWNEFLFANLLTTSDGVQPAIVELYSTLHGGQGESIAWGRLMAQSLIIATPPVILYFFSQRSLGGVFG
ncbi:carbohydrate ABC transporter permease [Halococcus saccharolyticus]|uniref:Binding-protein-dependent transport systems inner membrane component n=1 Tax=Halococcus saccharolyticus DSM 5350 TaxID=1227455 RepID=M0MMN4_9EURY|nr:carbohydrate ABC transporter permease [Halococcus saccharolyticus]EMA46931.1 binding-protein-dependent transport systems inner membrane component [Halococcus saccharolyticus DSM 5350]